MKHIFAAIGINFVGKNYAMGGTASAPEVALCSQSIFGDDIDSLVWDYGMTDGDAGMLLFVQAIVALPKLLSITNQPVYANANPFLSISVWKMLLYFYHAALAQSRPAVLGIGIVGHGGRRDLTLQVMEDLGMTSFIMDEAVVKEMRDAVPDTFGKTDEEIALMPPYIRHLRCIEKFEAGDPGCDEDKFNMSLCTGRRFRTPWHPGWYVYGYWSADNAFITRLSTVLTFSYRLLSCSLLATFHRKMHALFGNSMALFIIEVLREALEQLGSLSAKEREDLYLTLDAEEEADYQHILSSPIPEVMQKEVKTFYNSSIITDVSTETLYRNRSFCHTALLPAEMRYRGLLTETNERGFFTYDRGVANHDLTLLEKDTKMGVNNTKHPGQAILSYTETQRQECEDYLNLDYKDYFHISSFEGWRSLTLPNDAEEAYYNVDTSQHKGILIACVSTPEWFTKDPENLRGEFNPSVVQMEVNGEEVVEYSKLDTCHMLKNENDHHWKPNDNGKYIIRIRVNHQELKFIQFSSFILV